MAAKSPIRSAAPNLSATRAKQAAPTESSESAADKYMKELSTNPRFPEAPKTGQTFGIVGARPVKRPTR